MDNHWHFCLPNAWGQLSHKRSSHKHPLGTSFYGRALEQPPPHPLVANRPEEPIVAGRQVPLSALSGPCARLRCCHCACQSWNRSPGCMTPGRMPSLPALCCLSFLIVFIVCVLPPHTPLLWIEVNANSILCHLLTFSKWTKYHCYCSMSIFCLLRSIALFPRLILFSV